MAVLASALIRVNDSGDLEDCAGTADLDTTAWWPSDRLCLAVAALLVSVVVRFPTTSLDVWFYARVAADRIKLAFEKSSGTQDNLARGVSDEVERVFDPSSTFDPEP